MSLWAKLIGVVVVTVACIVPPAAYWTLERQREALESAHRDRGRAFVQLLDATIAEPQLLENREQLFNQLQRFLWLNHDLVRIEVALPAGDGLQVYVSTEPGRAAGPAGKLSVAAFRANKVLHWIPTCSKPRVARFVSPVHLSGGVAGTVSAELSLQKLDEVLASERRFWLLSALLLVIALSGALFVAVRHVVLRPLRKFAKAVDALARRDGEFEIQLESSDELGRLGAAFNHMAQDIRGAEAQAEHRATHDPLTGLPNRRLLMHRLQSAIAVAARYQRRGSVLYLDLDDFKQVNDQHGHAAGDQVLVTASERLAASVRQVDTVARMGGDEFVVLLHELPIDAQEARDKTATVARKILAAFAEPWLVAGQQVTIGASIGVRVFGGEKLLDDAILRDSDAAMYRAKAAGGQQFRFAVTEAGAERGSTTKPHFQARG
ncbi:MAG: diguanylate cyclase [Pseudomonadota bacterium]